MKKSKQALSKKAREAWINRIKKKRDEAGLKWIIICKRAKRSVHLASMVLNGKRIPKNISEILTSLEDAIY